MLFLHFRVQVPVPSIVAFFILYTDLALRSLTIFSVLCPCVACSFSRLRLLLTCLSFFSFSILSVRAMYGLYLPRIDWQTWWTTSCHSFHFLVSGSSHSYLTPLSLSLLLTLLPASVVSPHSVLYFPCQDSVFGCLKPLASLQLTAFLLCLFCLSLPFALCLTILLLLSFSVPLCHSVLAVSRSLPLIGKVVWYQPAASPFSSLSLAQTRPPLR